MRNDVQRPLDDVLPKNGRTGAGNGFFSARSLSNYMRIVSSGASNVASTVRSAGVSIVSSIADRHDDAHHRDQVLWAGFDKLESENDVCCQVLLLGYKSGFEVWDVEQAHDFKQIASRRDGPVSFLQMQKKLIVSKSSEDKFADVRPMLVVVGDDSRACQDVGSDNFLPTYVRFYSLRIHDYVHVLKFRSAIFSIRCSPRVVAISQASQIHCFNAASLEREYTILTSPVVMSFPDSGSIGYGPLAVGARWLAYSGNLVEVSSTNHVCPQDVNNAIPVPPNCSMMTYYAKESSKQLAAGLVTLGDMGYKKLSKYYSDFLADTPGSMKHDNSNFNATGTISAQPPDTENVGMVIVRDIVSKSVIVQFQAHASPISALCFDPSGTLLVTASIHGHNINVFRISPTGGTSGGSHSKGVCMHLYRLQRGITNAVIQDISFSDDSRWIMVSSSRGTCHLFSICSFSGNSYINFREGHRQDLASKTSIQLSHNSYSSKFLYQNDFAFPVTLSAVSRIRNGSVGLKGVVNGAAAAATGKVSPHQVAIASTFHNCKGSDFTSDINLLRKRYYLLVFSPSGSIIRYVLHQQSGEDSVTGTSRSGAIPHGLPQETDGRLVVEALQKWDVCHKRSRRTEADIVDIFGDHTSREDSAFMQKGLKKGTSINYGETGKRNMKYSTEETQQSFISEVELHTHEAWTPLWVKTGISFQLMMDVNEKIDDNVSCSGEIEIERSPIRKIEGRSKDPIPVFNYHQVPELQQPRTNASCIPTTEYPVHQKLGPTVDDGHSCRSSSNSPEHEVMAGFQYHISDKSWCQPPNETHEGFVNSCTDKPHFKPQLEDANSDQGSKTVAQLEHVNNTHSQKLENCFQDNDNDVD